MSPIILVPLDGSPLAERALAPAMTLAKHMKADLELLRVPLMTRMFVAAEAGYGVLYPDQSLDLARAEADKYLTTVATAPAAAAVAVRTQVEQGDVAGVVVDTAAESGADLIVMSSHGYSGVTRWLLGSVAERVLRAAPCPVWVVRSEGPVRRLLIPLDGSKMAEAAIAPALNLARCYNAKVTLLRVAHHLPEGEVNELDSFERGLGLRILEEHLQEATAYLAEVSTWPAFDGLQVRTEARLGNPVEVILQYAEHNEIDLVAMATHGRTGMRRWIYGSVTEKVLHSLSCSMLVARPDSAHLN